MLRRPERHLDRLTIEFRWEATRRHPVYLQLWEIQQSAQAMSPPATWHEVRQIEDVINACNAIRVVSEPVDPALSFEELSALEPSELFHCNALQPVTVKMMLGVIGKHLSSDSLRRVAETFKSIADGKDGALDTNEALVAFAEIINSVEPEMEAVVPGPFYVVSPVAPREQWQEDMARCQNYWREQLNLQPSRDRPRDYPNYLRAWDLSEGFSEGRYHRDRATSFVDVGRELRKDESTIRRWYHRAFFLITGHEFSNENWHSVMGFQQLSGFMGLTISPVSRERLRRTNLQQRDVDFSTVQQDESFLDTAAAPSSVADLREICTRVCQLIKDGLSDTGIIDRIEIEFGTQQDINDAEIRDAINYLRSRDDVRSHYLGDR
ncbi:hypothetical protein RMSM_06816 [Rhodopirellula maiorica SM1]|uniref:Uncharacterized protein n=1 Tax=Rhodopirellula maiorica SM1 TaxID=1265738 RepID=M5RA94_9BACT|nr:hypothetical protein [Rhodopirellula maiorica]EMI16280.1 hypothetical protein RMSM_06816 [Rhodopirellula maiorica SM1]